jgi:DNA-binding transcriptional ArsR family regulator
MLNKNISLEKAAAGFASLGSEARLHVVLTLVKAGNDGLTISDIQSNTKIPASTLAHHLRSLTNAGLIEQKRFGRTIINKAAYEHLEILADYLLKECCQDEDDCEISHE